jgi:signal transduction histidine kinase
MSGPVLGVVEIVQDLSEDEKQIFKFQIFIIMTCSLIMSLLVLVLVFVVKRGEGFIERRAQERLLLEEQLSRAKHLSALGEMAAGISHEIRNPLGIIRSSAELLKKKMNQVDPGNTIPDIIVEEAVRLNSIISDFLNYARPKEPQRGSCRVEEILQKNITYLTPQIEDDGYSIDIHCEENLPKIQADADMLYQAFLNILINSMQAMPEGGMISIDIRSNEKDVHLVVNDEGDGIPKDILDKVWDPFFTNKEKGTGLGLGIVKNIIEAHSGQVDIQNRPGKGARVSIVLPIKD